MGKLSPDPSNDPEENNLSTEGANLVMPIVTSSDSETDDLSHEGYEILPQDCNDCNEGNLNEAADSEDDDSSNVDTSDMNITASGIERTSNFEQALRTEMTELWSSSDTSRPSNIVMDPAKEELVKNAMAGFSLPSSSIPLWAKDIPEEEWKQKLIQRINSTKT